MEDIIKAIRLLRDKGYRIEKVTIPNDVKVLHTDLILAEGVDGIISRVCSQIGITKKQLNKKTRHRFLVEARQLAHYIANRYIDISLAEIGWKIGTKDHATVLHSAKTVQSLLDTNRDYREKYKNIIIIYSLLMKKHTKMYFDYFDVEYDQQSGWHNCVSEISGLPAVDVHHINARGMGGSKEADKIENLMALTREEHELYGDVPEKRKYLQEIHDNYIKGFAKTKS